MKAVRRLLLESVLDYYQHFIDERIDNPDALAQLTETKTRVTKILDDLTALQGGELFFMLQSDDVLKDLQTSSEQRTRLSELWRQLEAQRENDLSLRRSNLEEWKKSFVNLARRTSAEAKAILTQEQQQRLKQITLQGDCPAAFRQPEIALALQLTAEQKERIGTVLTPLFFHMPDGMGPPLGPRLGKPEHKPLHRPPPDRPPGFRDDDSKEATKQIEALLTEAQAERWRELKGKPFEGSFCPRPGLGGPDRGPKGGPPHRHFEPADESR